MHDSKIIFSLLCREELLREKERNGIGLYAEKRLHSVLKRWILDDFTAHEQKVPGRDGKNSRFVADILTPGGEIFEIQTGRLFPLARKIEFYMNETDFTVTVVHPLAAGKTISWLDPATGELRERRRSPRHESELFGIAQLKPFLPYLTNPRFRVSFPLVELEEYRLLRAGKGDPKKHSHRYELIPIELLRHTVCAQREDYLAFFPQALPPRFTAGEFGKCTKLAGYDLYDAIAVFEGLGALARCGKQGRSTLFERLI